MRILVTDGSTRTALAVVRSLGARGHEVIVGERQAPALAHRSRYCSQAIVYPDPETAEAAFVDRLVAEVDRLGVEVLVPIADVAVAATVAARDRFSRRCRIGAPSAVAIEAAANKAETIRLAEQLGVPVPRTWILAAPGDPLPADLSYPTIVKPHRSRVRTDKGWRACIVGRASTPAALRDELQARHPAEFPMLLQEMIPGVGIGVFAACHDGRPVAAFAHRRLREKPPWGGVSVLSESVTPDPRAWEWATRLLGALEWNGVAMVEYKLDAEGVPRFMEINGRFWGSLQLAVDAGVDFPAILLDILDGHPPATPPAYRVGVKNRWLWGDVDSLISAMRGRASEQATVATRARALGAFLKFWEPGLRYESPRLSDLRPFVLETRRWFGGTA